MDVSAKTETHTSKHYALFPLQLFVLLCQKCHNWKKWSQKVWNQTPEVILSIHPFVRILAVTLHCQKHKMQFECICSKVYINSHSFISIQPWRLGLTGTRAQSCDRYGSGTLHPGQVLGGSLPLLSPAFRHSHFSRQVPPSATTREILATKGGTVGEKDVW